MLKNIISLITVWIIILLAVLMLTTGNKMNNTYPKSSTLQRVALSKVTYTHDDHNSRYIITGHKDNSDPHETVKYTTNNKPHVDKNNRMVLYYQKYDNMAYNSRSSYERMANRFNDLQFQLRSLLWTVALSVLVVFTGIFLIV